MLYNTKVESIIEEVNRYPFKGEFQTNVEEIVEWVFSAIRHINIKQAFQFKEMGLLVSGGKALLPKDIHRMHTVINADTITALDDIGSEILKPNSYRIYGGYIYTYDEECELYIRYEALAQDERGYPLIPDDDRVRDAVVGYVLERKAFKGMIGGYVAPNIYNELLRQYQYNLVSAREQAREMTPDNLAQITKTMFRPLIGVRRRR